MSLYLTKKRLNTVLTPLLLPAMLLGYLPAMAEVTSPVRVAPIAFEPIPYRVDTVGKLAPRNEILSFRIRGRIERFIADEGERVKSGDVLAMLDDTEASDQLQKARVALQQAERLQARLKTLHSDGSVGASQMEDADAAAKQAQISFDQATLNLERCQLVAPDDGVILRKHLDSRTTIEPGQQVYTFQSNNEAWLAEVDLIDQHAFALKEGSKAEVRFAPFPGEVFAGTLTRLGAIAREDNGLFTAEVSVRNNNRELRPGMIAEINLTHTSQTPSYVIPLDALTRVRDARGTVFLLDPTSQTAVQQMVSIIAIYGNRVAVTESLEGFNSIIVRGQSQLKDGASVTIIEEKS